MLSSEGTAEFWMEGPQGRAPPLEGELLQKGQRHSPWTKSLVITHQESGRDISPFIRGIVGLSDGRPRPILGMSSCAVFYKKPVDHSLIRFSACPLSLFLSHTQCI